VSDVEAGKAPVEVGLQRQPVVGGNLGESGSGDLELAGGVLLLAESEQGGWVVGRLGDGGLETLQALVLGGRGGAANVVLKRAETDSTGGREEGLLGDGEVRVNLSGHLPCNSVLDVEEASQFAGVLQRRGDA